MHPQGRAPAPDPDGTGSERSLPDGTCVHVRQPTLSTGPRTVSPDRFTVLTRSPDTVRG